MKNKLQLSLLGVRLKRSVKLLDGKRETISGGAVNISDESCAYGCVFTQKAGSSSFSFKKLK